MGSNRKSPVDVIDQQDFPLLTKLRVVVYKLFSLT